MIPFSVLDLAPIRQGGDASQAFRNSLDLAQHAEGWGYKRFWLAEHHNMTGIASAATSVVIGHVAGGTRTIRVGSGGIMLPNHSPLIIAEQFGTLASLYPGRIDLGLGRAPGTDQLTARALRRDLATSSENFPHDVLELQALLGDIKPNQTIRAVPGMGTNVPLWILGSSTFGAQLAGMLGLPFAFASHFAPQMMMPALREYRARFEPSAQLDKPHAMVGVNVFAADSDVEAQRMFTSLQQQFINLRRGTPGPLPPPVEDMDALWSPAEKAMVAQSLSCSAVGSPDVVEEKLKALIAETGADELMTTGQIYDHAARLRSFEIAAEVRDGLAGQPAA
ncbi:LLM class flavin-dependent oxidoreductase [Bradyrhizobium sp. 197]|jgi:luciferase family oxidoreductase group 1|uniref:LLM class flavin-dependent oxidoreductase n=1 Tax=Bradyrhizobium sp. 197 TaxID=2782663 RepID=UPI001FF952EB|nr:LLM class flavin-dependent oxidoreductase [Bradyrhizobium sp. 197]MCK1477328.1 LLM class flavin-dependent oxidoreductase [Bradyrhizobium sp. 197]